MNEDLGIKEILEWYLTAGVDETCGEVPFALAEPAKEMPRIVPATVSAAVRSAENSARPATTELAQATINACQSARELCQKAETLEELKKMVEEFDGCALKLTANKTVFGYGSGTARLLLIGEAPGADEDRSGIPFVGRSGQLLEKMLKAIGFDRNECFITNVLPWRPPGNRTPTEGEIAVCLPFLKRQIDLVSPEAIMILAAAPQMHCWTTANRFPECAANGWSIKSQTAEKFRSWPVSIRPICCATADRRPRPGLICCG